MRKYKGPTADAEADAAAHGEDMDREERLREHWGEVADKLIMETLNDVSQNGVAVLPPFASDDEREMELAEMVRVLDEEGYNACVDEFIDRIKPAKRVVSNDDALDALDGLRHSLIMTLTVNLNILAEEWIDQKVESEEHCDDDCDGPGDEPEQDDPYFEMP